MACIMLEPWSLTHMYHSSSDLPTASSHKEKSYDLGTETNLKQSSHYHFFQKVGKDSMIKTLVPQLFQLQECSLILDAVLLVVVKVDC